MCGIAGWIDKGIEMSYKIPVLNKMSQTLERRGPDENGIYINLMTLTDEEVEIVLRRVDECAESLTRLS